MSEDVLEQLTWSDEGDNPFGMRCLDCRPYSRLMLSASTDRRIAERFAELRDLRGRQYAGENPDNAVTVSCDLSYPFDGRVEDGSMFVAEVMEDKWDIYLNRPYLYLARSWTGVLVFVAQIGFGAGEVKVSSIDANTEVASGDHDFIVRQVDFLIKSHVMRLEVPHPLPEGFPDDVEQIVNYSFGQYGRWASFAAFGDTSQVRIPQEGI